MTSYRCQPHKHLSFQHGRPDASVACPHCSDNQWLPRPVEAWVPIDYGTFDEAEPPFAGRNQPVEDADLSDCRRRLAKIVDHWPDKPRKKVLQALLLGNPWGVLAQEEGVGIAEIGKALRELCEIDSGEKPTDLEFQGWARRCGLFAQPKLDDAEDDSADERKGTEP